MRAHGKNVQSKSCLNIPSTSDDAQNMGFRYTRWYRTLPCMCRTPELEEKTGLRVDAQHSRSTWGDTEDGQHVGLPACL